MAARSRGGAGHRDLELARQEGEFRVQGRPLPDDLGIDARILDLVGGGAGIVVGGDVADAIAAGLDGVHLDLGQIVQDVRDIVQLGPVVLDVLPGGEMAEAAVVAPGDMAQHAQLVRRQGAVRDRHPQHVGVQLQVEPVHQPERLELVLGQLAGEAPVHLIAELRHPLGDQGVVEFVIPVHVRPLPGWMRYSVSDSRLGPRLGADGLAAADRAQGGRRTIRPASHRGSTTCCLADFQLGRSQQAPLLFLRCLHRIGLGQMGSVHPAPSVR